MSWLDSLSKRRLRRLGVKINNLANLHRKVTVEMEETASLGDTHVLDCAVKEPLKVGAHSCVRSGQIYHLASIGRFCSLGNQLVLGQNARNHPIEWVSTSHALCREHRSDPPPTTIGHDVWMGDGAAIMAGLTIGTGAVIGRGALVTKDVEPYTIVGGNPAKVIRKRFSDELIERLLASRWWECSLEDLHQLDPEQVEAFLAAVEKLPKEANYRRIRVKNRQIEEI